MADVLKETLSKRKHLQPVGAGIVDFLYPPRCAVCETRTHSADGLCPTCWAETEFIAGTVCKCCGAPVMGEGGDLVCEDCHRYPPNWSKGVAAVRYGGGVRRMLLAFKHGGRQDLAVPLAAWLSRAAAPLNEDIDLVMPVPLHRWRLMRRGFNQSAEIARRLQLGEGAIYLPDGLERIRATRSQDGKGRAARRDNLEGAICVPDRFRAAVSGKRVLLVDDVMTTGATLSVCASALLEAGAEMVNVAVVARVFDLDHRKPPG